MINPMLRSTDRESTNTSTSKQQVGESDQSEFQLKLDRDDPPAGQKNVNNGRKAESFGNSKYF